MSDQGGVIMYKVTVNGETVEKFEDKHEAEAKAGELRNEEPNKQVEVLPCEESEG